jgi:uncharacterized membrane protein YoaK (UPF0700 family)
MLRKFSSSRTLSENIKLGTMTGFVAGMVNVASLLMFFAFTSNVTGHYAIFAAEVAKGNYYQVAVVFGWIFTFFLGSFVSNALVINLNRWSRYVAHAAPVLLEIICLVAIGIYGQYHYRETLTETEILLAIMLFAMGLQNGLTASISNFAVKTTHLTGLTTDLGILFSMFMRKEYRENAEMVGKAKLLLSIAFSYVAGAVVAGYACLHIGFQTFYLVSSLLVVVILYDLYELYFMRYLGSSSVRARRKVVKRNVPGMPEVRAARQEQEVATI